MREQVLHQSNMGVLWKIMLMTLILAFSAMLAQPAGAFSTMNNPALNSKDYRIFFGQEESTMSVSRMTALAVVDSLDDVTPRSLPCIGNGSTGPRVKMIYAYKSGSPNRLEELRTYFEGIAKRTNGVIYDSANGNFPPQKIKFATNASCDLSIDTYVITGNITGTWDDVDAIKNQLIAAGYNSTNRKYLVEVDLQPATNALCGIGIHSADDQPGQNNANNTGTVTYSIVGRICWNSAEPHELVHTLGAVLGTAPRSTGSGHCNDDYDPMCYDDGGPTSDLKVVCPSISHDWRLDCNFNDYYDNDPTPASNYLQNHWNVADNRYLTNNP